MLLLNSCVRKKTSERQDRRNFESVRALFVICARLCTRLHFALVRMYSFSADQKRVIFSVY